MSAFFDKISGLVSKGTVKKIFKRKLFYFLLIIAFIFSPIQFVSDFASHIFGILFVLSLPVFILLWIVQDWKLVVVKTVILILTLVLIYILLAFCLFGFMVSRTDTILFTNKHWQAIKIEKCLYDDGALGRGDVYQIGKTVYFFPGLRYFYEIDTNQINKDEWIKVDR